MYESWEKENYEEVHKYLQCCRAGYSDRVEHHTILRRTTMMFSAVIVIILGFVWFLRDWLDGRQRPPGPLRFPLVGNMIQVVRSHPSLSHLAFHKLAKVHGKIMRLKVGFQEVVVISDFEIIKNMLSQDVFSGRHYEGYMKIRSMEKDLGVIFTSGKTWMAMRKFTVKNLRDFGFGRRESMESTISKELEDFVRFLKQRIVTNGGVICVDKLFHLSLLNVLWTMVEGRTFSHHDPKLMHLMKVNDDVMRNGNFGANLAFAFPFIGRWLPSFYILRRCNATLQKFIRNVFAEHRLNGSYATNPQSFIDVCLAEVDMNAGKEETYFTEDQFMITIIDLFQVGAETTGNTLSYAVLLLAQNPTVQDRLFEEINSHFPGDCFPRFDDRKKLPYTEATLLEVLRRTNVVPLPPPRKAMADTTYGNFHFPKECIVMPNFYPILMDEEFWGDPDNFRPERFLYPGSSLPEKRERVTKVFGVGSRICLGETLAQTSLFLYFTTLVKHFSFHQIGTEPLLSLDPLPGFILSPQPLNVLVRTRD